MFSLERERDDYWLARLDGQGASAQCSVYAYLGEGIGEFFRSMARDWRGWAGTRSWSSLEGDLEIEATADGLGHTTLLISLTCDLVRQWRVQGTLVLDAADLERLPGQVATLVNVG
jgi:hypothetical protein